MTLILTVLAVLAVLVISEMWWRTHRTHNEFSRKFVHITVGSFAAFWPYFLSRQEILLLSAAFIVAVLLSLYLGIFKAIHAVERPTWGEVCFAGAVGVLALMTDDKAIYTAALLHMGLADGMAALVGTAWGKKTRYKVLGHTKSIVGSVAFLLVSLAILIGYATVEPVAPPAALLVGIAAVAAIMENIAVRGLDNLLVPVFVASVLMLLG
jgi:phytol kinase